MKLITRDTDYAIRALCFIAKHKGKRIAVSELVEELKMPRPFLRKLLQILDKKGFLKSYKGQGGGFELAVSPNKIFLTDIMKIFQEAFKLNECLFKKHICPNIKKCILKKKIDRIERYVIKKLKAVNIACLLE